MHSFIADDARVLFIVYSDIFHIYCCFFHTLFAVSNRHHVGLSHFSAPVHVSSVWFYGVVDSLDIGDGGDVFCGCCCPNPQVRVGCKSIVPHET